MSSPKRDVLFRSYPGNVSSYVDTLQCLYFCLQDVFVVLPVIVVVKKYIDIGNMMTGSLVILFKLLFYVTVLSFLWWKEEICF